MTQEENWQFNKSALECHKYMLEHGIATDVTFTVCNNMFSDDRKETNSGEKESKTFQAHKYQLITRSPVFYAMLQGELAEKGPIAVTDVDPLAFKELLNYIYTDEANISGEVAMPLLYASKKYLIPGLTQLCVDYLQNQLSSDNACILYDHSLLFEEKDLAERAFSVIQNHTAASLGAPSTSQVSQTTLSKILDSERFTAPETTIFEACAKWATYQLQQAKAGVTGQAMRKVLGDCVLKVRYPTMTNQEFGKNVSPTGILLSEEEISIFRYFATKEESLLQGKLKSKNRLQKGPFDIAYKGEGSEMQISPNTVYDCQFEISCTQQIKLKAILLGQMTPGRYYTRGGSYPLNLTCSSVVDGMDSTPVSFQTSPKSQLVLQKDILLMANCKKSLSMTITTQSYNSNGTIVQTYPGLQTTNTRDITLTDPNTGVNFSVTSKNFNFVHGFTYDFP